MSTQEQVEAAKERMDAAHRALLAYVTRPPSVPTDDAFHKRLGEEFKNAHSEYGRLVAELDVSREANRTPTFQAKVERDPRP